MSTFVIVFKFGVFKILKFFPSLHSQGGSSEEFIGEWMEARGVRPQIVLATKV